MKRIILAFSLTLSLALLLSVKASTAEFSHPANFYTAEEPINKAAATKESKDYLNQEKKLLDSTLSFPVIITSRLQQHDPFAITWQNPLFLGKTLP